MGIDSLQIELAYPEKEWHVENRWFVKQSEIFVRLTTRDSKA